MLAACNLVSLAISWAGGFVWLDLVVGATFALIIGLLTVGPLPVSAQVHSEPGRGTATRSALMDAVRPYVEWDLSHPIEFIADELRVAGDVAYGSLSPQWPGGGAIDLFNTPGYRRSMNPE